MIINDLLLCLVNALGFKYCIGRIYFYPTTHHFSRWFSYARKSLA